jgi:hypothetical protein
MKNVLATAWLMKTGDEKCSGDQIILRSFILDTMPA